MRLRRVFCALILLLLPCLALSQVQDDDHEGGIIGTGIVGTITDLGSIYVNGQHILIEKSLPVTGAVVPTTAGDLRPGHIVAVTAHLEGSDWRAGSIRQVLSLVGPVESIGDDRLTIMGTDVKLNPQSPKVTQGDWVAISGLWQGRTLVASRIDPVPATQNPPEARVSGSYFGPNAAGQDVIGDTKIHGIRTRHLMPGDLARVFGKPVPGGIDASRLEGHLFEEPVNMVQVQGYLSLPLLSGLYTVFGSGLVAYTDRPAMIDLTGRVFHCGQDGRLGVSRDGLAQLPQLQDLHARLNCAR